MLFAVSAARLLAMVARMRHMTMSRVSMMRRLLMVSSLVMLRGIGMMARGMPVVFSGFLVMFGCGL
jgi:hypothetical protein